MKNNTNFSIPNDYRKCTFTNGIIRYFGTFIFLIGIISSVLSICVFARKPLRRKSCCFYFLILAISDSIHLLTMIIEHLPYSFHIDLIIIHTIVCKIIIFLIYSSNHLSNIILTLASVDRFILIYCPSHSKRYCNIRKGKWFVFISIIIVFIANGHILYGYEKIYLHDKELDESYDCNIREENIFYKNLFQFYDSYIESIFLIIIPFSIMFICSLLIIFQIIQTRKTIHYNKKGKFYYYTFYSKETIRPTFRKTLKEQRKLKVRDKDVQLSWMLIGTTFTFLILCLPTEINDIFNYTGRERSCFDWFRKVILTLMQQIYYAGHFYIYTLTGQLFRKHLYAIFFDRHHHHQSISQRESQYFSTGIFSSINKRHHNKSNTANYNEESKPSIVTTNFTNTTIHHLTTNCEIHRIQTDDNNTSNESSQQFIFVSKDNLNLH
ncbi:unnamed protein product [Rotaria sordida]|uniref:G-protein coupled receptors family 1 profile domain-containing protein n=1 Tax=Rotaria sordida TaxID=392033 RepID=A0A814RGB8_9BILA|nr:unnamed protein product [Rotaria sordida]CAF1050219.1 unnamed protein product [Rotaria sordida]CAF1133574.1 unnamed protein product [Rotaria sordida]CAF1363286.1 unnamed protein product [Rotaria sordida]CAF1363578.1 unnamed protein product [Rotaria sordida]